MIGKVSVGDLNGDGYNDIFASGLPNLSSGCAFQQPGCNDWIGTHQAKILLNDKKGGFKELYQNNDFDEPSLLTSIIMDIDKDGNNDLVFSNGKVSLNMGNAEFEKPVDMVFPISTLYSEIEKNQMQVKADFNNDGIFEIFRGGLIYFRTSVDPIEYRTDENFVINPDLKVEIADLDGDGFKDILTYGGGENTTIFINDKLGHFTNSNKILLSESEALKLVVGDIDNDNDIDIVFSNGNLLKNLTSGNFELIENSFELIEDDFYFSFISIDGIQFLPRKLILFNDDAYLDLYVTLEAEEGYFYDLVLINNQQHGFEYLNSENISSYIQGGGSSIRSGQSGFSADFNADGFEDFILINQGTIFLELLFGYLISEYQDLIEYISPVFFSNSLNLYLNNQSGYLSPSNYTKLGHSKAYLFDYDNDNKKEIMYSSYSNPNDNKCCYPLYYLSNIVDSGAKIQDFNFLNFNGAIANSKAYAGDFNNDGLDDLIVDFINFSSQQQRTVRLYYNSSSGFDINNAVNLEDFNLFDSVIADINGDGFNDLIGSSLYINNQGQSFDELSLNLSFPDYVGDINNDGFADMSFINSDNNLDIVYGQSDVNNLTVENILSDSTIDIYAVTFYDYNSDGLNDLYIRTSRGFKKYTNNNGNFEFSESLSSESLSFNFGGPVHNIKVLDLNNDGNEEILSTIDGVFYIYQKDDNSIYEAIYIDNTISDFKNDTYISHDFDGDNLMDIFYGDKIIFGRELPFLLGISYDQNHSGHGFSIEKVGRDEQFYTVFYTYGNDTYPEWYADLGLFERPREDYWNIQPTGNGFIKYYYDYATNTTVQNTDNSSKGLLQHSKCSEEYAKLNLSFEIEYSDFGLPVSNGDWCSEPIVGYYQRPQVDFSGFWWAGNEDSGWGWSISLVERENTTDMVLVLYYFDAQGNPRWLMGQQSGFEAGVEITVDMDMVKGYPRLSTPQALEFESAGTMSLTLNQASHDLNQAGYLSIDVNYPGLEEGSWVRDNIPIALFSEPRN